MTPNPPLEPQPFQQPNNAAREAVNLPSILLIVTGALSGLFALVIFAAFSTELRPEDIDAAIAQFPNIPEAEIRQLLPDTVSRMRMASLPMLLFAALIIFAGVQMRQLKMYGLCIGASIISMLPCASCCCLVGLPVGIWSLVVLMRPEVKNGFT